MRRTASISLLVPLFASACGGTPAEVTREGERAAGAETKADGRASQTARPPGLVAVIDIPTAARILDRAIAALRAEASAHRAEVVVEADWASDEGGLSATPSEPASPGGPARWVLKPRGGTVKRATADAMTALACHELGHFFGGFPFHLIPASSERFAQIRTVAASEGQADYWATKDCLPRLWASDRAENARYAALTPADIAARCDAAWRDLDRRALCRRIAVVSERFQHDYVGRGPARLATPDASVADYTRVGHLESQCELDTMLAGALCDRPQPGDHIPGLVPNAQGVYGGHSVAAERAAVPYACGEGAGARPRCWFHPGMVDPVDCGVLGVPRDRCEEDTLVTCSAGRGVERQGCPQGCAEVPIDSGNGVEYYAECRLAP